MGIYLGRMLRFGFPGLGMKKVEEKEKSGRCDKNLWDPLLLRC